jgi:predicted LPLAT superfamily acyltransferase
MEFKLMSQTSSPKATPADAAKTWAQQQERGSMGALKLITWIALHLGRPISRVLLFPIVGYFFITSALARKASRQYLSRIPGQSYDAWSIYRHLHTFASVILDRIYFLNSRLDRFDIQIKDINNQALGAASSGRGIFLMGAHMGSFESVRSIAREHPQLKMLLLMYEENAQKIKQVLNAVNPQAQQAIISLGRPGAMLEVKEQLSQGGLIGILADRSLDDQDSLPIQFLGTEALFPAGPFRLAAMLKHPVFFMAGIYEGDSRYTIHLEPIMDFTDALSSREQQVQAAVQQYVRCIERHCLAHPYNWFNFFDFWRIDTQAL